ncbi:hypothetical protein BaRGS_00014010, partial [Batillaria attramentaria]
SGTTYYHLIHASQEEKEWVYRRQIAGNTNCRLQSPSQHSPLPPHSSNQVPDYLTLITRQMASDTVTVCRAVEIRKFDSVRLNDFGTCNRRSQNHCSPPGSCTRQVGARTASEERKGAEGGEDLCHNDPLIADTGSSRQGTGNEHWGTDSNTWKWADSDSVRESSSSVCQCFSTKSCGPLDLTADLSPRYIAVRFDVTIAKVNASQIVQ